MKGLKVIEVNKDVKEKDFPAWARNEGYVCLKINNNNRETIEKLFGREIRNFTTVGRPDFFIYKNRKYWFCEFKSKNDKLSIAQIRWFEDNNIPAAVAVVKVNKQKKKVKNYFKDNLGVDF